MQNKTKVLVVDDEAIMRDSLHDWLTDAGHEVLIAEMPPGFGDNQKRNNPGLLWLTWCYRSRMGWNY